MESSVIILDSSDDETEPKTNFESDKQTKDTKSTKEENLETKKRKLSEQLVSTVTNKPIKRIKPTKLSDELTITPKIKYENILENENSTESNSEKCLKYLINDEEEVEEEEEEEEEENTDEQMEKEEKTPINTAFATLLDACRNADASTDMELLIKKKLIRYYEMVHPDFANSKSFTKTALTVAEDINNNPSLVYLKLSGILEELNIRRKSGQTVMSNEEITSTGNARRDYQIKRLNHALYILKKKIAKLDDAEVDLNDDDNSTYVLVERYKKRACEIYEKICDITGESKHAHRQVRKPIMFQGTCYPEFNRTIQTFVNRTKTFPDMFDVLRCLEHCNSQYEFRLSKDQIKSIAQDAFIKIGKSLQKRRKTDLYETVSYFTGTECDPALEDASLQSKLADNQKYHLRINELIDKYAAVQDKALVDSKCNSSIVIAMETNANNDQQDKENQVNNGIEPVTVALIDNSDNSDGDEVAEDEDSGGGVSGGGGSSIIIHDNEDGLCDKIVSESICSLNDTGIIISDDEELALP